MPLVTRTYTWVCPYCWEINNSIADMSEARQCYIEDCSVCCHPVEISFTVTGEELADLQVYKAQ